MKTGILLSVREKATRLPGKVLLPVGNCNVTEGLVRRLRGAANAEMVMIATSDDPRDDVLCVIAHAEGVACFRGHPDDKLVRYRDAARAFGLDFAVVVDGDDPFVSVTHIDKLIAHAHSANPDFITWTGLPLGATGFGVSARALEKVCRDKAETNTEIWGHLFTRDRSLRCVELGETDPLFNRPDIRMTLDYEEDYRFFCAVADGLAREGKSTAFENVLLWLGAHPEVVAINQGAAAEYEQHLARSRA